MTVRDLLQHTSGIRDSWQAISLAGWHLDEVITQEQVLRVLYRQKELNFAPGDRFLYSNGAYTLAAEIVEQVSGIPFAQFCRDRIFEPLGMDHTEFHDDYRRLVPSRSQSYSKTKEGFEASPLNYSTVGATGLFTTAADMSKWMANFQQPRVGGPAALALLEREGTLRDGSPTAYGLGLSILRIHGMRAFSHPGSDAGYRTYVVYFPDSKLAVAVLGNSDAFDAPATGNKIASVYLEGSAKAVSDLVESSSVKTDSAALKSYQGVYRINQEPVLILLRIRGN